MDIFKSIYRFLPVFGGQLDARDNRLHGELDNKLEYGLKRIEKSFNNRDKREAWEQIRRVSAAIADDKINRAFKKRGLDEVEMSVFSAVKKNPGAVIGGVLGSILGGTGGYLSGRGVAGTLAGTLGGAAAGVFSGTLAQQAAGRMFPTLYRADENAPRYSPGRLESLYRTGDALRTVNDTRLATNDYLKRLENEKAAQTSNLHKLSTLQEDLEKQYVSKAMIVSPRVASRIGAAEATAKASLSNASPFRWNGGIVGALAGAAVGTLISKGRVAGTLAGAVLGGIAGKLAEPKKKLPVWTDYADDTPKSIGSIDLLPPRLPGLYGIKLPPPAAPPIAPATAMPGQTQPAMQGLPQVITMPSQMPPMPQSLLPVIAMPGPAHPMMPPNVLQTAASIGTASALAGLNYITPQ